MIFRKIEKHLPQTWQDHLDTITVARRKHVYGLLLALMFLVTGFEVQSTSLSTQQSADRCEARGNLANTLREIVDLSDLFPNNILAEKYTETRTKLIDSVETLSTKGC